MMRTHFWPFIGLVVIASMLLVSCQPPVQTLVTVVAGTPHKVTVNGVVFNIDAAQTRKIVVDGQGGNDTAQVTGSSGKDTATLSPKKAWSLLRAWPGSSAPITVPSFS